MSYTSESICSPEASLKIVKEVVELLGYKKVEDGLKVPDRKGCYFWIDREDYRSYSGVELNIYKKKNKPVVVTTRSTVARSYWDLTHQNKTLRLIRDLLGGNFTTDAGKNRYWHPEELIFPRKSGHGVKPPFCTTHIDKDSYTVELNDDDLCYKTFRCNQRGLPLPPDGFCI